jgi:MFS family permease
MVDASPAAAPPQERPSRFALLRYPQFARIWLGHSLSALGSHLSVLALPLFILHETGSAAVAGLSGTIRLLAYLAVNLPAGVLADRLPRRATLLAADAVRGALIGSIGVSILAGRAFPPAGLIALAVAETAISAVAGPAGIAATRHLVPTERLAAALALGSARGFALRLAGPLLGGVLYQVDPALPFLADALSYAISLVLVLSVRRPLGGGGSRSTPLTRDIASGLRLIARSRFIVLFMTWAALTNFATGGLSFALILVIGAGRGAQLGTAMAMVALGGMLGAAVAPRLKGVGEDRLLRGVTAATAALGGLIALRPAPLPVTACVAGIAALGPLITVPLNARLFALVPDELTGRVQSSLFLVGGSLSPFASAASGWLAEHLSVQASASTFAGVLVAVLILYLHPGLRLAPAGAAPVR